ncbi:hypothetical protein [Albirhodobacter sp. R86504]|uniref:hypothetical protein n=1 Tax=Albirhodobacter sp. R86504 TaxID=3093848 RepID=UPI00366AC269
MDSAEQAEGEKRVRRVLIDPLLRRGLAKPSSLTKAQFDASIEDLCERLAYMTETSLAALEEQVAAAPAGKDRDRLPIANVILEWAGQIQPPVDDASPLIRAVFANALGQDALAGGWAPELLIEVRKARRWPGSFVVTQVKDRARDAVRQLEDLDRALSRGDELSIDKARWRAGRLAMIEKCRQIAALSA